MMKIKVSAALLALALLVACATQKFTNNAFRTEQTAVNLAYTAYVGWTNYLATPAGLRVTPGQSNEVKQVRLKFAESLVVVEHLRTTFSTNSMAQPAYEAALSTLESNAGELVALINTIKGE